MKVKVFSSEADSESRKFRLTHIIILIHTLYKENNLFKKNNDTLHPYLMTLKKA